MCIRDEFHNLTDRMIHLYNISSPKLSHLACMHAGMYILILLFNCSIQYMVLIY